MATISKRDETLVIELSALEKSGAMHGDLEIPAAAISSVEVLDELEHGHHLLTAPTVAKKPSCSTS